MLLQINNDFEHLKRINPTLYTTYLLHIRLIDNQLINVLRTLT
jgi:hypothetical protein